MLGTFYTMRRGVARLSKEGEPQGAQGGSAEGEAKTDAPLFLIIILVLIIIRLCPSHNLGGEQKPSGN